jgi:hypothetical protein
MVAASPKVRTVPDDQFAAAPQSPWPGFFRLIAVMPFTPLSLQMVSDRGARMGFIDHKWTHKNAANQPSVGGAEVFRKPTVRTAFSLPSRQ